MNSQMRFSFDIFLKDPNTLTNTLFSILRSSSINLLYVLSPHHTTACVHTRLCTHAHHSLLCVLRWAPLISSHLPWHPQSPSSFSKSSGVLTVHFLVSHQQFSALTGPGITWGAFKIYQSWLPPQTPDLTDLGGTTALALPKPPQATNWAASLRKLAPGLLVVPSPHFCLQEWFSVPSHHFLPSHSRSAEPC